MGTAALRPTKPIKTGSLFACLLKRIIHPKHLWQAIKLKRAKAKLARVYDDPQLKLYADILPGGFLHYGYFDDPNVKPQDLSLNDILRAQQRHSEWIVGLITDRGAPVLDVGCGMGGLTGLMLEHGIRPVALSPDRNQVKHVRGKYPQIPVIEAKFEDIPAADNAGRYGTIITSESLQYLNLDVSLPLIAKLLKPGGRWIAYDYFRIGEASEKSGHMWTEFERRVLQAGWRFVFQQDHTANVVPTLKYVHMWGNDIARAVVDFSVAKLKSKQPHVHYLCEEAIAEMNRKLDKNLDVVNPETFAAHKRYMLLALEKAT